MFKVMESLNGLPALNNFGYSSEHAPLSPFTFFSASAFSSDSSPDESTVGLKSPEFLNHHQRCSSESYLIDEQPSWLEDLLNEPAESLFHRGHRRSASDSCAYVGEAAAGTFTSNYEGSYVGTSARSQSLLQYFENKESSLLSQKNNQESEVVVSSLAVEQSREEAGSQKLEGSAEKASGSQAKPSASKRAKQHNAHRSRVRKLQYIAHLERTVEILKAEASEVSAELEFVEQQNIILTMENRTLRQRLESVSQEQIIKHWEQGMLEREIGRLQTLYHLQKQQQMQMHQHQQQQQQQSHNNQYPKHRRNRSRDLDHQANGFQMKNKDASLGKCSVRI